MRSSSFLIPLFLNAIISISYAQSVTTSFKTVNFQPILLDVTVAEWDLFDHEHALYLTCPSGSLVVDVGPVIYDATGQPVWMNNSGPFEGFSCADLNVQTYDGRLYLTVYVGVDSEMGTGRGSGIMLDNSFNVIQTVNAGNEFKVDLHEFHIPEQTNSTALVTIYNATQTDLTSVGLDEDSWVLNAIFQEVDIASGEVLFQWSSIDHLNLSNSHFPPTLVPGTGTDALPWDAVHLNSVDKDDDGNYLVSSRHFKQLYKIDGTSGDIIWLMGGNDGNFTMNNGTDFNFQHHARWLNNFQDITLFDDGASNWEVDEASARGLLLSVDQTYFTVTLIQDFYPAWRNFSQSQGSMQSLNDGNYLVGYGSNPWMTEHLSDGTLVWAASIGPLDAENSNSNIQNYRVFKVTNWVGKPTNPPDAAVQDDVVYVSWNGATEVETWVLYGGSNSSSTFLTVTASITKSSFESNFTLDALDFPRFVSVHALDSDGNDIGQSGVYQVDDGLQLSTGSSSYANSS